MKTPIARPLPCPFCGKLSWRFVREPGTWATQIECTVYRIGLDRRSRRYRQGERRCSM